MEMNTTFSAIQRIRIAEKIAMQPGRIWTELYAYLTAKKTSSLSEAALRAAVGNYASDSELVKYMMERLSGNCYPVDHFVMVLHELGFADAVEYIRVNVPAVHIPEKKALVPEPSPVVNYNPYAAVQANEPEKYCTVHQFEEFKNKMENYYATLSNAQTALAEDYKGRLETLYQYVQSQIQEVQQKCDDETQRRFGVMLTHVNDEVEKLSKRLVDSAEVRAISNLSQPQPIPISRLPPVAEPISDPSLMSSIPESVRSDMAFRLAGSAADMRHLGLKFSPQLSTTSIQAQIGRYATPSEIFNHMIEVIANMGVTRTAFINAVCEMGFSSFKTYYKQWF